MQIRRIRNNTMDHNEVTELPDNDSSSSGIENEFNHSDAQTLHTFKFPSREIRFSLQAMEAQWLL